MAVPGGKKQVLLAVATGGGHLHQLSALAAAFGAYDVVWLTTLPGQAEQAGHSPVEAIPDCNRNTPKAMLAAILEIRRLVRRHRPAAVVTTGALPGLIALWAGRGVGAKTVWIDSMANGEDMSLSGKLARHVADLRLSQWPDVAAKSGAEYAGSLL